MPVTLTAQVRGDRGEAIPRALLELITGPHTTRFLAEADSSGRIHATVHLIPGCQDLHLTAIGYHPAVVEVRVPGPGALPLDTLVLNALFLRRHGDTVWYQDQDDVTDLSGCLTGADTLLRGTHVTRFVM